MKASTVHIVQHLRPGGIETLVLELQKRDPACHIVSLEGSRAAAIAAWPRLGDATRMHFLEKPSGLRPSSVIRLAWLLRRLGPQHVHTHHIGPLLYGGLAARLAGIPVLAHTEHDAWHLDQPGRAKLLRQAYRILKPAMISDAGAVAKALWEKCQIASTVVRNGIDTAAFTPSSKIAARNAFGLPKDAKIIGCAGRMVAVKNQALLLQAFDRLGEDSSLYLTFAGDGDLRPTLEARVRELGLSDRVFFLGRVDDMPRFYAAVDLFVLPSDREGYPLSLIEAQAVGTPVIATNVGGAADAVCPETGQVVPAGCAIQMANAIEEALQDQSLLKSPRDFALSEGSIEGMAEAYHRLYAGAVS